jgi:hypothetical protein
MKCERCGKDNPADVHTCSLPEALALAEYLDAKPDSDGHCRQAAAELRRLHEANEALREALKLCMYLVHDGNRQGDEALAAAQAALARAGGKT